MTIAYALAMPQPETHLFHVRMDMPVAGAARVRLAMPAWAPGSYLIRDFARHVQDFEAADARGRALAWRRVDKQTWEVDPGGARRLRVRYRVYAHELGVQSSHLDVTHGYANGTSVFLYVEGRKEEPCRLAVKPYPGWRVDVALPEVARHVFEATDYDHLADAPLEIGTHRVVAFRARGKRHRVALYGRGNEDPERIARDLRSIVEEEAAVFGGLPYEEYLFIVHLAEKARGGLEHRGSNTSAVDRWTFQPDRKYEDFLALEAHEFFHTWNVKRLRPAVLGPFDYTKEVHTTLLWAMEGLTSYYDHLVLVRAGLMSPKRYREFLGETITKLLQQPGRAKLSLAQSSFLAWVKLYKQDANWINAGISYYLKGELVGLALDLAIRDRTDGKSGLDDVLRALHARYPPEGEGIPEPHTHGVDGWRKTLEEVTGLSWRGFWTKHIEGTEEIEFDRVLRRVGWRLRPVWRDDKPDDKREQGDYATPGGWAGWALEEREGRLRVKHVLAGSPAEAAGVSPDDDVVALDGYQAVDKAFVEKRLREREAGHALRVHLFRRHELVEATLRLAAPPPEKWVVEEDPRAGARARRLRRAWLAPLASRPPARQAPSGTGGGGARARIQERGE